MICGEGLPRCWLLGEGPFHWWSVGEEQHYTGGQWEAFSLHLLGHSKAVFFVRFSNHVYGVYMISRRL